MRIKGLCERRIDRGWMVVCWLRGSGCVCVSMYVLLELLWGRG